MTSGLWFFHHYNAPAHAALSVCQFLTNTQMNRVNRLIRLNRRPYVPVISYSSKVEKSCQWQSFRRCQRSEKSTSTLNDIKNTSSKFVIEIINQIVYINKFFVLLGPRVLFVKRKTLISIYFICSYT